MNLALCQSALNEFSGKRVLVVGDLMLDEHIWGTVRRISPEAPVMVVDVDSPQSDCLPGGAANVANNLRALGAEASVIGVIGDDEGGDILLNRLVDAGVDVSGVFKDKNRPTTRKTRIWASHRHQLVRIDRESKRAISRATAQRIVGLIEDASSGVDAILLSDYNKGVLTKETAGSAIRIATEQNKISVSNPKPKSLANFTGIGVLTLNQSEASAASGIEIIGIPDVEKAGRKLVAATQCSGLLITRGGHGLSTFSSTGEACHIPAVESEVYDVAGAGDSVVSALTLALACGLDLTDAAAIANCSGGAVVRKVGVATTSVGEIGALLSVLSKQQAE